MKNKLFSTSAILLAGAVLFFSCQTTQTTETTSETDTLITAAPVEAPAEVVVEELADDVKGRNIFVNTTAILTGSFLFMAPDAFGGMKDGLKEAFGKFSNGEASADEIDQKIATLPAELLKNMDEMKDALYNAYGGIQESHPAIYDKMFKHELMAEGIAIAESIELPAGFKPLTQNLDANDLRRYILKMQVDAESQDDAIIKGYQEVYKWMEKISAEFKADTEIATFLSELKKKN